MGTERRAQGLRPFFFVREDGDLLFKIISNE
jgi:hypothetical protein